MNGFIDEDSQFGYTGFSSDSFQTATFPNQDHDSFDFFWIDQDDPSLPTFEFQGEDLSIDTLMTTNSTTAAEFAPTQSDNAAHQAGAQAQNALNFLSSQLLGVAASWPDYHILGPDNSALHGTQAGPSTVNGLVPSISGASIPITTSQLAVQSDFRRSTGRFLGTDEQISGASTSSTQSSEEVPSFVCHDCKD